MAQFNVYALSDGHWIVDVQSRLIGIADTIVAVPLFRLDPDLSTIRRLNPEFTVNGEQRIFMAQLLTAVRRPRASSCIWSLADHEYDIKNALDFLLSGI